jgi:hypothetical protein
VTFKLVENCYCCGCNRYYVGPPGKYKDEISVIRCPECIQSTGERVVFEYKLKWRTRRDGTRQLVKSVHYY